MTYEEGMALASARLERGALEYQVDELAIELNRTKAQLVEAERDIRLLARQVTLGEAFGDWLLMQDQSSAVLYAPQNKNKFKKISVEDQDDLTLALAFIASRAG